MRQVLRREKWPALARARDLLSPVVDRLFRGDRFRTWIAWRAADSLGLRQFLRIGLDEETPDHSTLSRTRALDRLGNPPPGVPVGAGRASRSRSFEGENGGCGRDNAGGQCGHAIHCAPGYGGEL